jgi:hypothetical protein
MRYAEFQEPSTWSGGANPASPKRRRGADCNVWTGVGWVGEGWAGVHVFAPDGTLIGVILLPEICANYVFGGAKHNRLFMVASTRSTPSTPPPRAHPRADPAARVKSMPRGARARSSWRRHSLIGKVS